MHSGRSVVGATIDLFGRADVAGAIVNRYSKAAMKSALNASVRRDLFERVDAKRLRRLSG
ncbi:hypothetical protein [Enhygromyxa salina]|uniref:hypothetical protein n=1 Tax=Enhygromyxa salina TaxID=215803 RepID=UPI0011B25D1D|nr:hypothetical protein [Enhygromyxa salina]